MRKHRFKRKMEGKMNCDCDAKCGCGCNSYRKNACGGGIYFLGFIGSAIYYISQAGTFWQGVLGLLKAAIWPVFLVYKLLGGM